MGEWILLMEKASSSAMEEVKRYREQREAEKSSTVDQVPDT